MPPNPLPLPTDPCYSPLGIASLPDSSFTASAEQQQHPARAARLHHVSPGLELQGWAPPADTVPGLPSHLPFLQLDLLQTTNLTGGCCVPRGIGTATTVGTTPVLVPEHAAACQQIPHLPQQGWWCRGPGLGMPSSLPSSCSSALMGTAGTTTNRSLTAAGRSPRCCLCHGHPHVCVCGEGLHRAVPKCTECPFAASNVMTPCPLPCTCGWVQVCWCTAVHMDLCMGLCMSLRTGVCMGVHMGTCTGVHPGVHPFTLTAALPQLFQGNWDATTPVVQPLDHMVQARYVRILPQGFHNAIFLRAELLGCPTGTLRCAEGAPPPPPRTSSPCPPLPLPEVPLDLAVTTVVTPAPCGTGEFWCGVSCVTASRRCDGATDCPGGADEAGCEPPSSTTLPTHPARYWHWWGPGVP